MNQKLLIAFFLVCVCYSANSQTTVYHSFPDSNAVWSEHSYMSSTDGYNLYSLFGDTIINALKYHKVYSHYENQYNHSDSIITIGNSSLIGAIREDSLKRIYFYNINFWQGQHDSVYRLYDFSIHVGDTIFYNQYPSGYAHPYLVLNSIDSVLTNGQYRKRFNLQGETWIEGIGSTRDLLSTIMSYPTCYCINEMVCYKFNNITYYLNPLFYSCYPFTGVNVVTYQMDENISVSPNPSNGKFTIQMEWEQSPLSKYRYVIYNMLGKKVYQSQISNLESQITLDIPDGLYFISIILEGEILTKKIQIIN